MATAKRHALGTDPSGFQDAHLAFGLHPSVYRGFLPRQQSSSTHRSHQSFPIVVDTVLHDTRKPWTAELLEAPIKDAYWSATLTAYSFVQNQAQAAFLLVTATLSRSTVLVNAIGSFFCTDGKSLNDLESLLQTFDWKRVPFPWKPASQTYVVSTSTLHPQSPDRFVARGLSAVHQALTRRRSMRPRC